MARQRRTVLLWLFAVFMLWASTTACTYKETIRDIDDTSSGGDSGADSDNTTDDGICDEPEIPVKLKGVKVMFLVDFSSAMTADKWTAARQGIEAMVADPANADTYFGLHLYPNPDSLVQNVCDTADGPAVPLAQGNGAQIANWMLANTPISDAVPLVDALRYYSGVTNTNLHDFQTSNFAIVLSGGPDTCYSNFVTDAFVGDPTANILAGVVDDLKDISNIKTVAIGVGAIADGTQAQLNAIARNGGSAFKEYIPVADGTALATALQQIATSIRPCTCLLDSPDAVADRTQVNFRLRGVDIDRDISHVDGWDWTQNDELEVAFYGQVCTDIQNGAVGDLTAVFGCPTQVDGVGTCSKRDFFLPFPRSAILFLTDVSSSMLAGDKWGPAMTAVTNMVVDDRNNHNKFGLVAFPSGQQGDWVVDWCEVGTSPEVGLGGADSRLMIVEWAATPLPAVTVSTPLLAGLERLIDRPGGIEEPEVNGVVIVLTDGADNCAANVPMAVADQLTQTVGKLVQKHNLRVFPIGYGANADAVQLNAIAAAGNIGSNTYLSANSQAELDAIFDRIESAATSCVFNVPYAGADVPYDRVNLFFDGLVVPRDIGGLSGWDWVVEVQKDQIEFFGDYCQILADGRVSAVLVEFGCETVVI